MASSAPAWDRISVTRSTILGFLQNVVVLQSKKNLQLLPVSMLLATVDLSKPRNIAISTRAIFFLRLLSMLFFLSIFLAARKLKFYRFIEYLKPHPLFLTAKELKFYRIIRI